MRTHDDGGLGLIELIVAVVVSGVLLVAIASIFFNSWKAQEEVTSVTQATNRGQVVGSAIERAVRNGVYYEVSGSGTILRVSTSLGGDLKCQGFRLTADGTAQFATGSSSLPANATSWADWQDGIRSQGSTPYFDDSVPGVIAYAFEIDTDSTPVRFAGKVSPRSVQEGDSDSCW
ncbi:type II secretion system protein [Microbacterium thalassium]|uniref:Tfp pilus assembly protein PilW n=1 Tax=Microbacterium thalassium TaxID=362649 RepID=A0A7X0FQ41_9MICO|nr:hypothetical protein [Microbacterium thalassium]MBB6391632.1 Tfp pilus assembly protein PilW [Microbacterium thalassium]